MDVKDFISKSIYVKTTLAIVQKMCNYLSSYLRLFIIMLLCKILPYNCTTPFIHLV